jgi:hypothetical protein
MTVCIAAACTIKSDPAVVLCHDWQGTVQATGSTDTIDKQRYLGNNWIALFAGDIARADEIVGCLEGLLSPNITSNEALDAVRRGVIAFRQRLTDQMMLGTYGIDFDRFIREGRTLYTESIFNEIHRRIVSLEMGVQLLISGFVRERDHEAENDFMLSCIIQVCEPEQGCIEASLQDSFACIGEGAASAQTSLLFRSQDRFDSLSKTVYQVYEAKTLAEIIPTVGESTSIYLQRPNKALFYINGSGFDACNAAFKAFGPKKISSKKLKEYPITLDVFSTDKIRARSPEASGVKLLIPEKSEGQQ